MHFVCVGNYEAKMHGHLVV